MGEESNDIILDSIELRKDYDVKIPLYEKLVNLVSMVINSSLEKKKIKVHSLKQRVKDYSSFLEKIERKRYANPFRECTDLAGCRIVCLFLSQVEELKKIIEEEFEVIEFSDKRTIKKFNQFGYLSLHMLVKLKKHRTDFVEYSDLKDLICEIQIRTILQEAWAEIEHYLNYKATKEEKREDLLRKIFSLAGMFEVADATFEDINHGFVDLVKEKLEDKSIAASSKAITALSLFKFSKEHFSWFEEEWDKKQERRFYQLSTEIKKLNLNSISKINEILTKHKDSLKSYEEKYKNKHKEGYSPCSILRAAIAFEYGKKADFAFGMKGFHENIIKDMYPDKKYGKIQ